MGESSLTIFFEAPFWVGVYQRTEGDRYQVCKITFGAEPKDYEVWDFLQKHWGELRFSPPLPAQEHIQRKPNPKRMQREIRSQLERTGVGTKAQQALQAQREESKLARKTASRAKQEAERQRHYALRQQKKKEKHRGR